MSASNLPGAEALGRVLRRAGRGIRPALASGSARSQDGSGERRPDLLAPAAEPAAEPRTCPAQQARAPRVALANGWEVEVLSGAGGKQPAAILLRTPHWRGLLDAGASLDPRPAAQPAPREAWLGAALRQPLDAVLISHDHVDHVGAAGQLPASVPIHATPEVAAALPAGAARRPLPLHGQFLLDKPGAPPLAVRTGASGHSLGGVWLHVAAPGDLDGGVFYSGDVSLESALFHFDVPPRAELALLDASYGCDDTSQPLRLARLAPYLDGPLALPVPATGRALEVALWLQARGRPVVLDEACRRALQAALRAPARQFAPGVARRLALLDHSLGPQRPHAAARALEDPAGPAVLLADPAPGGGTGAELAALLADGGRRHAIVYTGYCPPGWADGAARGVHVLRWNVHPRLRDLDTLLAVTQARTWLPLFTAQSLPDDPGSLAPAVSPEAAHAR